MSKRKNSGIPLRFVPGGVGGGNPVGRRKKARGIVGLDGRRLDAGRVLIDARGRVVGKTRPGGDADGNPAGDGAGAQPPAPAKLADGVGSYSITFTDGGDGGIDISSATDPKRAEGEAGTMAQEFGRLMMERLLAQHDRAVRVQKAMEANHG